MSFDKTWLEKILTNRDNISVKVISAKSLYDDSFLEAKNSAKTSHIWKYVYLIIENLLKEAYFRPNIIENINFWHDMWTKESPLVDKVLRKRGCKIPK